MWGALLMAGTAPSSAHDGPAAGNLTERPDLPPAIAAISATTREGYLNSLMSPFRRAAGDDRILDQSDIDSARLRQEAAARASLIQGVLKYDLDADGSVTRDEIERSMAASKHAHKFVSQIDRIMDSDANGDGRIEIGELLSGTPNVRRNAARTDQLQDMLKLDPDGDGRLTGNELEAIGRKIFADYDTDGDGYISDEESAVWQKVRREAQTRQREQPTRSELANCRLTPAAADAEVVMISAYGSRAIADVTVAGQDETTVTSEVYIEPGEKPILLVAATMKPRIWRFRGSTERVAKFFALSAGTQKTGVRVGVVGLPKERIEFLPPESCFRYFTDEKRPETNRARRIVEIKTGRQVGKLVAAYDLTEVALPSGITPPDPGQAKRNLRVVIGKKVYEMRNGKPVLVDRDPEDDRLRPASVDPETYQKFRRYSPAGVVGIQPEFVVSPKAAERYEVLPEYAGIVELLKDGSLQTISNGEYRIAKPIARYPAGLTGALAVQFLLADGVPEPQGSPGHSCVKSEAIGKALANSGRCR